MERNFSLVVPNQCNIMQNNWYFICIYGVVVLFLRLYYVQIHASIHLLVTVWNVFLSDVAFMCRKPLLACKEKHEETEAKPVALPV